MLFSRFGTTAYVGTRMWYNNINYFSLWDMFLPIISGISKKHLCEFNGDML